MLPFIIYLISKYSTCFTFYVCKKFRYLKREFVSSRWQAERYSLTEYQKYSNFRRFSNHISPIFFARWSVAETNAVLRKQRSDWYPRVILARALKIRKKIHAVLDMKYEIWRSSSIPPSSRLTRGFQLEGRDAPRGSERGRWRREEINASASVRFTFYIPASFFSHPLLLPSLFSCFSFSISIFVFSVCFLFHFGALTLLFLNIRKRAIIYDEINIGIISIHRDLFLFNWSLIFGI